MKRTIQSSIMAATALGLAAMLAATAQADESKHVSARVSVGARFGNGLSIGVGHVQRGHHPPVVTPRIVIAPPRIIFGYGHRPTRGHDRRAACGRCRRDPCGCRRRTTRHEPTVVYRSTGPRVYQQPCVQRRPATVQVYSHCRGRWVEVEQHPNVR